MRQSGNERDASRRAGGAAVFAAGVSTGGNTLGTTGTQQGTIAFAGIGNLTLSQATGVNGATISISGGTAPAAGFALIAGTQTLSNGSGTLSNANGFTFGMAGALLGSGTITVSADFVRVLMAGTQTQTGPTSLLFTDSNGISFGLSSGALGTITASHNAVSQLAVHDSTGNQVNLGVPRLAFSNVNSANYISFGKSVTSNTFLVTASLIPPQISFWDGSALKHANGATIFTTRLLLQRINIPAKIDATLAQLMLHVSNSSSAGGTVAFSFAVYTMTGSTANMASSASRTWAYNSTLAGSSYTDIQLTNYRSMSLGTWNITPGDYLFALQARVTTALTSGTYSWLGGEDLSIAGYDYGTGPVSYFNHGKFSTSTAAFPATIHATNIQGAGFDEAYFFPYFQLVGTN